MIIALLGRSFCQLIQGVGNVLKKNSAARIEESANIGRKRVNRLIDNQFVCVAPPGRDVPWQEQNDGHDREQHGGPSVRRLGESLVHLTLFPRLDS